MHVEVVEDLLRLLGRHPPVGVAEVEADQVRPRLDRRLRPLEVADPADLDANHWMSSRTWAAGSAARIRSSPTRIASAPASCIRLASSAERIPLSATTTTSGAISLRS